MGEAVTFPGPCHPSFSAMPEPVSIFIIHFWIHSLVIAIAAVLWQSYIGRKFNNQIKVGLETLPLLHLFSV